MRSRWQYQTDGVLTLFTDDFIINKYRGKSGPLFNFDVHDDVRMIADASVEKDEVRSACRWTFPILAWQFTEAVFDICSRTLAKSSSGLGTIATSVGLGDHFAVTTANLVRRVNPSAYRHFSGFAMGGFQPCSRANKVYDSRRLDFAMPPVACLSAA